MPQIHRAGDIESEDLPRANVKKERVKHIVGFISYSNYVFESKEEQVKVINTWFSPFGMRVSIGLEEKGVKYEFLEENLYNKSEFLLEMNPVHKKIPMFIHNGKPLVESLIILEAALLICIFFCLLNLMTEKSQDFG
eukprot:Gb_21117 [translate_table: standard]